MNVFPHGLSSLWILHFIRPIDRSGNPYFDSAVHGGLMPDLTFSLGHTVTLWALALLTLAVGCLDAL
jgi:hypothetical protein